MANAPFVISIYDKIWVLLTVKDFVLTGNNVFSHLRLPQLVLLENCLHFLCMSFKLREILLVTFRKVGIFLGFCVGNVIGGWSLNELELSSLN